MLNFLVIGDWGRKGTMEQRAVANGMTRMAERFESRFVVTTGDNFYDDGVSSLHDDHWRESFEDVYTSAALKIPWYVVLGNHDYRGCVQTQLNYSQMSSRWRLAARYYAVHQQIDATATALLVFLDTSPFVARYYVEGAEYVESIREQDTDAQLNWLQETLAASNAQWKLVFAHHPIYSASPFHGDTLELQQRLLPLLQRHHVQAYICGHEHDLQHLSVDGVDYVVCGAGAERRETGWRDISRYSASTLGFSAVSLTANRLRLAFYDAHGQELYTANKHLGSPSATAVLA